MIYRNEKKEIRAKINEAKEAEEKEEKNWVNRLHPWYSVESTEEGRKTIPLWPKHSFLLFLFCFGLFFNVYETCCYTYHYRWNMFLRMRISPVAIFRHIVAQFLLFLSGLKNEIYPKVIRLIRNEEMKFSFGIIHSFIYRYRRPKAIHKRRHCRQNRKSISSGQIISFHSIGHTKREEEKNADIPKSHRLIEKNLCQGTILRSLFIRLAREIWKIETE